MSFGVIKAIHTAFMRRNLDDWERAEDFATTYTRAQVERFSPKSRAILEIQSKRDLEILEKIYANAVLLGDQGPDGWGIRYAREFDMTNDSRLFPPRPRWEAKGYRPDEYSRWLLAATGGLSKSSGKPSASTRRSPSPRRPRLRTGCSTRPSARNDEPPETRFVRGSLWKPGDVARTD